MRGVRQQCNLCGSWVHFTSITQDLGGTFEQFGFPWSLDDFETLNHAAYGCPSCGSSDRDRLYKLFLDAELGTAPVRLLDFAPAEPLSKHLRSLRHVTYRTADLMMDGVDDVVDITDMDYADQSFDFFICSHVLEHVSDDALALSELHRVLSPGGRGIVMAPVAPPGSFDEDTSVTDPAERWRRFAQDDHVRLYDRSSLVARIFGAGFELRELGARELGRARLLRHGIRTRSRLYVVRRPV
jgi:SAM-dependent methyltransferase